MKKSNIIFDLGGVIEKIDPKGVIAEFKKIGVRHAEDFFSLYRQSEMCSNFETGHISSKEFIAHIKSLCKNSVSDKDIISAWCANQLGVEKSTLSVLKTLRSRNYKLYILSNTNPIHYAMILRNFKHEHNEEFEPLFNHVFLSYEIGKRKPNNAPYQHLMDSGILPLKSIYIDDLDENLTSPRNLGFSTLHHKTNESIDYLLNLYP